MYDCISCEMPLPFHDGAKTNLVFKNKYKFQTKDLDNFLTDYKISKDKILYEKKVEYEDIEITDWFPMWHRSIDETLLKEKSHEWVKYDFTGYIRFYGFLNDVDDTHDALVVYRVHVKLGEVQNDVELETYKHEDNTGKKDNTKKWKEEARVRKEYAQKWRYKYCFKYWNMCIRYTFLKFRNIHAWSGKLVSWKVEHKFKF